MPEVTVVIPTHNRWSLLATSLDIVRGQEDVDVEVIVVDDGSTDETAERLAEIDDPRLRVLRHEQARGVAAARNSGMREARADWVGFCDDDDLWAPRKLRTQLEALEGSDALFCYGPALMLDADRSVVVPDQPAPAPDDLANRLAEGNVLPGGCSNVVMRTDIARELGGFDERLSMVADWDLWLRLANRGPAVTYPDILVAYRWHGSNMTAQSAFARREREFAYFVEKHRSAGGRTLRPTGYSRWLAAQAPSRREAARVHLRTGLASRSPGSLLRAVTVVLGARRLRGAYAWVRGLFSREPPPPAEPTVPAPDWLEPHRAATERVP